MSVSFWENLSVREPNPLAVLVHLPTFYRYLVRQIDERIAGADCLLVMAGMYAAHSAGFSRRLRRRRTLAIRSSRRGCGGTNKRLRVFVAFIEVSEHGILTAGDCRMAAVTDAAFGDFAKEPLYETEPIGAGGGEVDLIAGGSPGYSAGPRPSVGRDRCGRLRHAGQRHRAGRELFKTS
jgi:hypothetical protein